MIARRLAALGFAGLFLVAACGGSTATLAPIGTAPAQASTAPGASAATAADSVATYRAYIEMNTDLLVTRTKAFTDAVIAGKVAQAKALYAAGTRALRGDRARGRGLRRPRSRDRCPDQRRPGRRHVHRVPPDRAGALAEELDGRDGPDREEADDRRDPAPGARQDRRPRPGHDRQRRGRAAQRGLVLEDHRRGGPLLAHRPVGLRGQRRRLAGRLDGGPPARRRLFAGPRRVRSTAASTRSSRP